MQTIMIGLDIAKSVFQVHAVTGSGERLFVKRLRRGEVEAFFARQPAALVGLEACGSGHHWARVLDLLGHQVRLLPPAYVKPFVKRNKNDARDAEAICEAMARPTMRFVPVKSAAQQAVLALHRSRDLLVRQRTQIGNAIRGQAGEFGIVAAAGARGLAHLMERFAADGAPQDGSPNQADVVPALLRPVLAALVATWRHLDTAIAALSARIAEHARADEAARRLTAIPGVGPVAASLAVAKIADPALFRCGRDFAAWLGLTPKDRSSGATTRSGGVSKQGDRGLRRLLVLGAMALVIRQRARPGADPWLAALLARRPVKVAAVARAAKNARIIWALLARNQTYRQAAAA